MTAQSPSHKFKVILLGDAGVGKTSIAKKQAQGSFDFKMNPTVGASHLRTQVNIENEQVELMLWDTAGQEQFASLVPMYARNTDVCILVASLINPESCDHLADWLRRLQGSGENPPVVVAINKTDLQDGAPMTLDEVRERFGQIYQNLFFVSARTGDSIDQLFAAVASLALHSQNSEHSETTITPKENPDRGCC